MAYRDSAPLDRPLTALVTRNDERWFKAHCRKLDRSVSYMLGQLVRRHRAAVERLGAEGHTESDVATFRAVVEAESAPQESGPAVGPPPPAVEQETPVPPPEPEPPEEIQGADAEGIEGSYVRTFEDPEAPEWVRGMALRIIEGIDLSSEEIEAYRRWCRGENVDEPRPPVAVETAGGGGVV